MRNTKKSAETLHVIIHGALTYKAVAETLKIPYSSATARVRRLVKAGRVARCGEPVAPFMFEALSL